MNADPSQTLSLSSAPPNQIAPSAVSQMAREWFAVVAGVCAILGHNYTCWLRFKGGKGVATGVGVFLAVVPSAVLIVLAIFAVIFIVFRYVSLASIIATAAFPVVGYLLISTEDHWLLPFMLAGSLLIILKHHQNIRRLLAGTEPNTRATSKSTAVPDALSSAPGVVLTES